MKIIERTIFPALLRALADQRVIVITGMRRVGKTTTLRWLLEQVPSSNKLFLDLERRDLRDVFKQGNYETILNYLRNLGLDTGQPMTVALDEIQYVPELPGVVKYLYDHYGIKFLLTGSSSYYLKNLFSESMSGRKIVFEMLPLGFGEYLDFHGIPYRRRASFEEMRFDPSEFERLSAFYNEYIAFGGLPNVVLESRPDVKREILNDILSSYINMDVLAIADFRKINELQQLMKTLALRIGNKLDVSKLSQIIGISRPTLIAYLEFLEKTYVIYQLPAYTGPDRSVALGKKLYFRDNGIASILAHPGEGALFENAVFNQLKAYGDLSYLSKGNEYEVDFVLTGPGKSPVGLEAKYHPLQADAEKLGRLGRKHGLADTWIVGWVPVPGFESFLWGGLIF